MPIVDALSIYDKMAKNEYLKIIGVACHIGSQLQELNPFRQSVKEIMQLVRKIEANGIEIQRIDCGGGLGISYSGETLPRASELVAIMKKEIPGKYVIAIEPGALNCWEERCAFNKNRVY